MTEPESNNIWINRTDQEFFMVKARQITKLKKMKTINKKIQSHYSPVGWK